MKSVTIIEYKRGKEGLDDTLHETARHYATAWSTAVAHVAENTILESDAEGNLMVLHQNTSGVTAEDRRRLEVTSETRLGEMVNRIRSFEVPESRDPVVVQKAFLGTVSRSLRSPLSHPFLQVPTIFTYIQVDGSIYLFALIAPPYLNLLMRLQSNIAEMVRSPGNIPFNSYRAYKSTVREAEEPYRFVDGELMEKFLDCSESMQEEMCKGLPGKEGGVDVEEVRGIVEGLRRLH